MQDKILKVDEENKRISFGMKESYFVNKSVTGVVPYKEFVEERWRVLWYGIIDMAS